MVYLCDHNPALKWVVLEGKSRQEARAIAGSCGPLGLGLISVKIAWAPRFWETNRAAVMAKVDPEHTAALGAAAHIDGKMRYKVTRLPPGGQGIDLCRRLATVTHKWPNPWLTKTGRAGKRVRAPSASGR